MKNVYHIRRKKKLNKILSDTVRNNNDMTIFKGQMAVLVHLHYADTVERYFNFLQNVPKQVDIYISTSETETKRKILANIEKYNLANCKVLDKKNRGRDISALLIVFREIAKRYEYVCFLHDKKGKHQYDYECKELWITEMWKNMLASETYVYNIKDVFDHNENLGILSVPEPFHEYYNNAFDNSWYEDFDNTVLLAERLGLRCDLNSDIPPITMATIFWCRTIALWKLFDYPWCYEDFKEEPLPDDGMLNHAVERILAYVAQDAGYDTGSVRTIECAEGQVGDMQYYLQEAFQRMEKRLGVWNMDGVIQYEMRKQSCASFSYNYEDIYVYGAGKAGMYCLCLLRELGVNPKAFLVTKKNNVLDEIEGIPVWEIDAVTLSDKSGVIVAVDRRFREEMIYNLEKRNILNYHWVMQ